MNKSFFSGEIISPLIYDFIYNSRKHTSIIKFQLRTIANNENYEKSEIIELFAYDEIADMIYREYKENEYIIIMGKLNTKLEVNVLEIEKIQ